MVFDSCDLPSSAREDIAQIKRWTLKPVTWLVNTHWHPDHVRGNYEYRKAFPTIAIVAQQETVVLGRNYEGGNLERRPARVAAMRTRLQSGISEDGKPLNAKQRAELGEALTGSTNVRDEMREGFRQALAGGPLAPGLVIDTRGRAGGTRPTAHAGSGRRRRPPPGVAWAAPGPGCPRRRLPPRWPGCR